MLDAPTKSCLARYIVEAARLAPSADNSQPFQFVWNGEDLAISFSPEQCRKGIFDATAHATLLSLGGVIENIEQAAMALNLELKWQPLNLGGEGPLARATFVWNSTNASLPKALPLFGRHTNRFPFSKRPIPSDVLLDLGTQTLGAARIVVFSGNDHKSLVHCARVATQARFSNEELHHGLMGSLRFDTEAASRGDGLDIATMNLPPGGVFFMKLIADWERMVLLNGLGLYKLLASMETQLLDIAPAIVCVVGKGEGVAAIEAGRLLVRVWTDLNCQGLAVHPYYVITDQLLRLEKRAMPPHMEGKVAAIKRDLPGLLGLLSGESIHMLLRVGFPKKNVPRSKRLSLESVFTDLT